MYQILISNYIHWIPSNGWSFISFHKWYASHFGVNEEEEEQSLKQVQRYSHDHEVRLYFLSLSI